MRLYYASDDAARAVERIRVLDPSLPDLTDQQRRAIAVAVFYSAEVQEITGDTSDGFHTFNELYRHRMLLTAALFNLWQRISYVPVYKSRLHSDGQVPFPDEHGNSDWFIVVAELEAGQVSYHYQLEHWDLFEVMEVDRAPEWDGHTAQEAADRLARSLKTGRW